MARHIEPALMPGDTFNDQSGEVLGAWDNHDFDTPLERLADHAGISQDQAALALAWMRNEQAESVIENAAEMLGRLFEKLVPHDSRTSKLSLSTCGMRLIAARILMNRDGTITLTEWASRAGISKQILSWHIGQLESVVGLHWLAGKKAETTEVYAESARARWAALSPEQRRARRAGKKAANSPSNI